LTRDAAVRGFDRGITSQAIIRMLNRLSNDQVTQNLEYCLKDWENRHNSVSLYQGLILCLDEERRYLVEIEPLSRFIVRTLSPGVYLLYNMEKSEAIRVLRQIGIDIVAQHVQSGIISAESGNHAASGVVSGGNAGQYSAHFPPLFSGNLFPTGTFAPAESGASCPNGEPEFQDEIKSTGKAEFYMEHFRQVLNKLSIVKSKQEELKSRIEKHLILNETQLSENCVSFEKLEAHLLDNIGKINIIRDAVRARSTIEVRWLQTDKESEGVNRERQVFGIPKNLDKSDGKQLLPIETQDGEIKIPLQKILYIRRIKESLFE
jgi:hypothetical protein